MAHLHRYTQADTFESPHHRAITHGVTEPNICSCVKWRCLSACDGNCSTEYQLHLSVYHRDVDWSIFASVCEYTIHGGWWRRQRWNSCVMCTSHYDSAMTSGQLTIDIYFIIVSEYNEVAMNTWRCTDCDQQLIFFRSTSDHPRLWDYHFLLLCVQWADEQK